jgi:hypothetical protein
MCLEESSMDDLLAKLHAGPSGDAQQDRATMQRSAHEIQRLQAQLEDARNQRGARRPHLLPDENQGGQGPLTTRG